ncbi:alkaline phosphatase family protein [Sneathiella marina]|uniref:Alkaline phosphatase family protein n=1 Tax=Sneathiella marina TaxID=2950108 RepID=A0ABY4W147_9PROT|nr:alkaline phosphatase family protein [Sneathiella marina]USG59798.1 alkaline phosphatase family protein [Sneathiella marina]
MSIRFLFKWSNLMMFAVILVPAVGHAADNSAPSPKLVLQITVDQLRGDLPTRYFGRLGDGGLRYLLDNGTVYTNAHHQHANTETIVGHTTLATGADPSRHGMIGNVWLDRITGELTYNVEDARYPILSEGAGVDKKTEIDPTQRTARSDGRSPSRILVSTYSDELKLNRGGRSKIFGVSVKDRGAISMAGHTGKAFWFSKQLGQFITSQYYYEDYPDWVRAFNAADPTARYVGQDWVLMHDPATYLFGAYDDRAYETSLPGFGRTFPHPYGQRDGKYFTTFLTLSPAGDEITLDFAKKLLKNEALGKGDVTDYLSVSFSSTDYVGHIFGPSSLEAEDNVLRLDRTLADLLSYVDTEIGLENTLIVLSADHGGPEAPGYLNELGIEATYIDPAEFDKSSAIAALKKRFGIGEELISTYFHPYLYLNRNAIAERELDLAVVEAAVAEEISKFDGVTAAVSSSALRSGQLPDTPIMRSILRNYNANRSGDIYVVFDPNRFINDFDGLVVAASHGSPWRYDTYVPIIFVGKDIPAQKINRLVHTVSIAPTLALLTGTKPPSGSFAKPLFEVIN